MTLPFPAVCFPLHRIVNGACGCGKDGCARIGKHPAGLWSNVTRDNPAPPPAEGAGYGIRTGAAPEGSNVVVVDLDDAEAIETWQELGGGPETFTVKTPRGLHLYLQHPGFEVRPSAGIIGKHIDFRGDGGFVVGPGSPHRSGKTYEVVQDVALAPMPAWLVEWFRDHRAPPSAGVTVGDVTDPDERKRLREVYAKYLREDAPTRGPERRGRGDATLFEVVQRGAYDLALPVDDVLELVREHYDPRCSPMWGDELDERVRHKANDAKTKSTRSRKEPPPKEIAAKFEDPAPLSTPTPPAPRRLIVIRGDDLAKPVPPVPYVWRHFGIAPGRPSLLAGFGGIGKTFVGQWLGIAIAAGIGSAWDSPIASGPVLWLDYEMTLIPTMRRLQRIANGMSVDLRALDFGVVSMPRVYLSDADAEDEIAHAVDGHVLAFVDNLAAATATSGEKENESGIRKYLDKLTRVTDRTGCTFVTLVHERKAGKDDHGGLQRVRGSSAITDAAGAVISISTGEGDGILSLTQSKGSARKNGDELMVKIEDVGSPPSPDEDSPGLRVMHVSERPPDERQSLMEAKVLEALAHGPLATKKTIESKIGGKKGAVGPAVDALVVRRKVVYVPGTGYVLDSPAGREERILAAARTNGNTTPGKVAKAAFADESEVQALIAAGRLHRSGMAWVAL